MEHRFEYLTSEELKPFIAQKALVVMGIGTIEEHGAHLPTGTDWFITQRFTDDLSAYLDQNSSVPFLTLPAIWTGYSATLMQAWPGTIRMATRTVMDMMRQIIGSLCEMGFDKFLILNGHGHHTELLRVVAREIADDHGVFPAVTNFFTLGAKEYNAARTGPTGTSIHGGECRAASCCSATCRARRLVLSPPLTESVAKGRCSAFSIRAVARLVSVRASRSGISISSVFSCCEAASSSWCSNAATMPPGWESPDRLRSDVRSCGTIPPS